MNKEELSGTVVVATNSVLNSMITFNLLLTLGRVTESTMEGMLENIPNYTKTINFSKSVLSTLTTDAQLIVEVNLEAINEVAEKNTEMMGEMNCG